MAKPLIAPKKEEKKYFFSFDGAKSIASLPKQARDIIAYLKKNNISSILDSKLHEVILKAQKDKAFETVQNPYRIFQYYRPRMIENDILKVKLEALSPSKPVKTELTAPKKAETKKAQPAEKKSSGKSLEIPTFLRNQNN